MWPVLVEGDATYSRVYVFGVSEVNPSGTGVSGSPALSCQAVTSPIFKDGQHQRVNDFQERGRDEMEHDSERFPGKGTRRDTTTLQQQGAVGRV